MRKHVIGVMGPRDATDAQVDSAYELGRLIARKGWVVLSGGIAKGVMDAVNRGAKEEKGTTVGILPDNDTSMWSEYVDIPIVTKMDEARNFINAMSSEVLIAIGMSTGTATEVGFALRAEKHAILLDNDKNTVDFFSKLSGKVHVARDAEDAVRQVEELLK